MAKKRSSLLIRLAQRLEALDKERVAVVAGMKAAMAAIGELRSTGRVAPVRSQAEKPRRRKGSKVSKPARRKVATR